MEHQPVVVMGEKSPEQMFWNGVFNYIIICSFLATLDAIMRLIEKNFKLTLFLLINL